MTSVLVTARPSRWRRRARTAGRVTLAAVLIALHLAVGVVVLAVRITHVIVTATATQVAYAELYLAQRTGRPALGQAAGIALTTAFAAEFRTAHHANTH